MKGKSSILGRAVDPRYLVTGFLYNLLPGLTNTILPIISVSSVVSFPVGSPWQSSRRRVRIYENTGISHIEWTGRTSWEE